MLPLVPIATIFILVTVAGRGLKPGGGNEQAITLRL